jgi:hypothetical protein
MEMDNVIKYLEEKYKIIKENIKIEKEYSFELKEYKNAINWLKKIDELKLENIQKYNIIELPDPKTGYSYYRIMNDCETDDVNEWIELKIENEKVEACMGDILIIHINKRIIY